MLEFAKTTASFPPSDSTIVSMQPWLPGMGKEGLIYRNSYSIADDKGRLKTSTHSFPALPTKEEVEDMLQGAKQSDGVSHRGTPTAHPPSPPLPLH